MPELNPVVSQEGALVGDEAVNEHVHKVEPDTVEESVDAQVVATPQPAADKVNVHETSVQLDTVITDPSSPLAVQVPDAGRGSLDLPIHGLNAPTVEEVFASKAASIEERDADAPVPGAAAEPNPDAHE
jgi:hypothetical protein